MVDLFSKVRRRAFSGKSRCVARKRFCRYCVTVILLAGFFSTGCSREQNSTEGKTYRRIAAGSIFAAEILWKLGPEARRKTAAVPQMIDDPKYSTFTDIWPEKTPRFFAGFRRNHSTKTRPNYPGQLSQHGD